MARRQPKRQGELDTLVRDALADLAAFWVRMEGKPAQEVCTELMALLPTLGDTYGDIAAEVALAWYDDERRRAGITSPYVPVYPKPVDVERWQALAAWGTQSLETEDGSTPLPGAYAASLTLVAGGLQRTITDQHRAVIVATSKADDAAGGWERVGLGGSCEFCAPKLGVGMTDDEVFPSHDHCNCQAAPRWR